ncbi:hypothetical protein GCM10010170_085120 [Dactylosporangium salmoneum]|uniref:Uncharacterized protein n=1 Tax=Dactylosporangium salmoneum TaxID=53361 RepID=A0ABN3HFP2_9ACTN
MAVLSSWQYGHGDENVSTTPARAARLRYRRIPQSALRSTVPEDRGSLVTAESYSNS